MSERVLDASVLLASILDEPFNKGTNDLVDGGMMSSVNYLEVWSKLHDLELDEDPRVGVVFALLDRIEPFTVKQADVAAGLRTATRNAGLSLADRACLALAIELGAEVYTADRAWARVDVGAVSISSGRERRQSMRRMMHLR